ncbi:hypothetical protein V6N12_072838 [Hibiscus sabdariffa]|uniref:Uncharacterized protein n=1 Tax=Hibiscus sabdariffa TaxID=183260 RepID=A0ABR2BKB1_9ROSI
MREFSTWQLRLSSRATQTFSNRPHLTKCPLQPLLPLEIPPSFPPTTAPPPRDSNRSPPPGKSISSASKTTSKNAPILKRKDRRGS